jgi:hypothetical protein
MNEIKVDSSARVKVREVRDSKVKTNSGTTKSSRNAVKIAT